MIPQIKNLTMCVHMHNHIFIYCNWLYVHYYVIMTFVYYSYCYVATEGMDGKLFIWDVRNCLYLRATMFVLCFKINFWLYCTFLNHWLYDVYAWSNNRKYILVWSNDLLELAGWVPQSNNGLYKWKSKGMRLEL